MLVLTMHLNTTTKVISAWDNKTNTLTIHHLQIEVEFPYETEVNKDKIIHYATTAYNETVYMEVFESPAPIWDQMFANYGHILLDNLVLLK